MKKAAQSVTNQRLINARKQRGWLQREVADQIGTTRVNISRWEQGITLPSPYFRQRLCSLFEKNISELGLLVDTVGKANEQVLSPSSNQDEVTLNIPHQNPFFTGRDTILTYLHSTLHSNKTVEETQVQVISGLGGIGKTQIAVEYVYRYHEDYRTILWIRAETPAMLIADLMAIANLLNILQKNEQDQHHAVYAVKRWLKSSKHWLLVLDNVGDFTIVNEIIPWKSMGHVIVTTLAQSTGIFAHHIELKQMELDEATLFILHRCKFITRNASLEDASQTLRVQAKTVAIKLNCFPLALDQASAYIEDTGCSLSDYLDQYQIRRGILLDRRGSLVTDHPMSVSTTLFLCFKEVERANLVAAEVLQLCSFLGADAIPEKIITEAVREFVSSLQSISIHFVDVDNVLATLRKYSLLQRHSDMKMFSVHQLVQVVIKERMDKGMLHQWAERAVRVVNHAFPQGKESTLWWLCQLCLIHVEACAELIEEWNLTFTEAGRLLHQAGVYLREHTQYMQAEKYLRKAKDIYEQKLELQHSNVAEILNDLAILYWNKGQYMKAEEFYLRALTLHKQQSEI